MVDLLLCITKDVVESKVGGNGDVDTHTKDFWSDH
jgi:hypothetical protein